MPSISPDEEKHFVQIDGTLCASSSSGRQPGAEQDGELGPLHFCGRVLLTDPYEPLSCPKHMYFLNQYNSHANSFQINPMVEYAWIEAVLHGFHCQHSHPGNCSSWRAPNLLWTQLRHRNSPENRSLHSPFMEDKQEPSPKGSQPQLASLIIKYMLLGFVSWLEEENMVHCMSLWVHIIPCKGNS